MPPTLTRQCVYGTPRVRAVPPCGTSTYRALWSAGAYLARNRRGAPARCAMVRCATPRKNLLVGTRHVVTHIMRTDTHLCTVYYLLRSMIGRGRKRGASTRSRRRLDRASAPACKPIELPMTCGCDQATS